VHITRKRKDGVSVIIPTFNRSLYLYTTLLLLLNQQTDENLQYEILVIDAGSDDTHTVIDFLNSQEPCSITYCRVKCSKNNSQLRNKGAQLSQYDILIFLDDDMLVPPDFIRTHYDRQKEKEHLVLSGRRRSLTGFSIRDIGEEALCTDFNLLEKLPWYEDERMYKQLDCQVWRYVFPHSMSIHAADFFAAGKFNPGFNGLQGIEGHELGFNLMNSGCSFAFLSEPAAYHQPHSGQSNTERYNLLQNRKLFIKMHNCFAVELYISLYQQFDTLYPVLKNIQCTLPDKQILHTYSLILGCLFSSAKPGQTDTMFLGTYIPKRSSSCKNVLVLKTFYSLPHEVQNAVIAESFRVSSHVYFEEYSEVHKQIILSVCRKTGISVSVYKADGNLSTVLIKKTKAALYSIVLPDILAPEKRYAYTWLAYRLSESGYMVTVHDMKNVETSEGSDFSLPYRMTSVISSLVERSYGFIPGSQIHSSTVLLSANMITVPEPPDNCIIHDEDFVFNYKNSESRGHTHCMHLNEGCYELLSFASVYDTFCMYERKKQEMAENDDSFCCFMENGYLEDGIDIVLNAFFHYKAASSGARLTIKLPDYEKLFNKCYPLHNAASRNAKTFGIRQKINSDFTRLNSAVAEYNLTGSVVIIRQNMNINGIFAFIDSHAAVVNASRGCCTPPQIYAAILLQKKTIVAQHQHLMQPFLNHCITVKSELNPLAEELQVPLICRNAAYSAGRIHEQDLCRAFAEKKGKMMTPEKAEETACLFNPEIVFRPAD
jgi:glycosyltransferase involved in cell wall biosynthesis